jgi:hypothetical protein
MWNPPSAVSVSSTPGGRLSPSACSLKASSTASIHSASPGSEVTSPRVKSSIASVSIITSRRGRRTVAVRPRPTVRAPRGLGEMFKDDRKLVRQAGVIFDGLYEHLGMKAAEGAQDGRGQKGGRGGKRGGKAKRK